MIETRIANDADFLNLLKLIEKINEKEKEYLRYNQDPPRVVYRLAKNIIEGHVTLFTEDNEIFGFIEYSIGHKDSKIWVYSLYISESHRTKTYRVLLPFFNKLKNEHNLPVCYTIDPTNKQAAAIAKFLKAKPIRVYQDGRIEVRVEVT